MFYLSQPILRHRIRRGTSALSATVALTLIAISVSVTVPQYLRSREELTACEAIDYLANVYQAQEQFRQVHGHYAGDIDSLDLAFVAPTHFDVGPLSLTEIAPGQETWSITLTRYAVQTVFGPYSITCDQDGFKRICGNSDTPLAGLKPKIKL